MDHFSKFAEAFPTKDRKTETVAEILLDNIITRYSCIKFIQSDQGKEFNSNIIKMLYESYGISQKNSSPYHPQTNGVVERFNQTLIRQLKKMVCEKKNDWDKFINAVLYEYRTREHSSTKISPFEILFGIPPLFDFDIKNFTYKSLKSNIQNEEDIVQNNREKIYYKVKEKILKSAEKMKNKNDKKIQYNFKVRDEVYIQNLKTKSRKEDKLADVWIGPCIINRI